MRVNSARPAAGQAHRAARAIGAGRVAVGMSFLAFPVASVRLLGVDTATASRLTWLARMTAARDAALGAGTLAATRRGGQLAPWLLAGAACDAVDASAIGTAAASGGLDRLRAGGVVLTAVAGVAVAGAAVVDLIRASR